MLSRGWFPVRLWIVSLALFGGGFIARIVLELDDNVGFTYPAAVELQGYCYLGGLLMLLLWTVAQAHSILQRLIGVALLVLSSFVSLLAILSSVPK